MVQKMIQNILVTPVTMNWIDTFNTRDSAGLISEATLLNDSDILPQKPRGQLHMELARESVARICYSPPEFEGLKPIFISRQDHAY